MTLHDKLCMLETLGADILLTNRLHTDEQEIGTPWLCSIDGFSSMPQPDPLRAVNEAIKAVGRVRRGYDHDKEPGDRS